METPQYPPPYPPTAFMPECAQCPPPMVVTTQPTVVAVVPQPPHKDYLAWSIVNMICCCLPFGIVALVYSIQTREAIDRHDSQEASRNSHLALIWNLVSLVLGLCINVVWIGYVIYVSVAVGTTYSYYG